MDDQEMDFTRLKYVLYARKSSDDPQRQVRSIGDQIFECKQLATRLGLNVVKVLEETKSAKKPKWLCYYKIKICREIFLNFTVDEEKVLSYQLKPHFEEMLKHRQSTASRGGEN